MTHAVEAFKVTSCSQLVKNIVADAVVDDIPSFIGLRVPSHELNKMSEFDLEEATSEAITLLVDEAQHGLVRPATVVTQLEERDLTLFLYFYLRGLYKGEGIEEHTGENRERLQQESKYLVDDFADKAVQLFAKYDRSILMDFLRSSTSYAFEKAAQECERYRYDDELVYLYSKTGQMKRALFLIIDRLKNVKKAIEFAKEQDDPDLWSDLLDYSMDKPKFIRGLLEQVGTSINPITLVRLIRETRLDAKIDSREGTVVMNHPPNNVYQQVIEKTKGGFFRTQVLNAAVSKS
ncbi:hypothetical protein BN1723_006015 [Verticillium longisporum]|uniref:ELYS-like domain-containing protein n=1 Tax=Verticillium longisporum TaxID=100787 RepID=A0A0G4NCD1_VERLO|nr:hypothetical protein BN1723_006015 [Verticillium longisporum]